MRVLEATPQTVNAIRKAAGLTEATSVEAGSIEVAADISPRKQAAGRTTLTPATRRNSVYIEDRPSSSVAGRPIRATKRHI